MRFQVLSAVKMSMLSFRIVTVCGLLGRYRRFVKHTISIFTAEDGVQPGPVAARSEA
jgi:hypothetical protein